MINLRNARESSQKEVIILHYSNGITPKLEQLIFLLINKLPQGILILFSSHDDAITVKENATTKANIIVKASIIAKVALEATTHVAKVVALV